MPNKELRVTKYGPGLGKSEIKQSSMIPACRLSPVASRLPPPASRLPPPASLPIDHTYRPVYRVDAFQVGDCGIYIKSGNAGSPRKKVVTRAFDVKYAAVGPVAIHLPERVETNDQLQAEFPLWDMKLIYEKTGIFARHIAAPDECASDLGVRAAEKLFVQNDIDPGSIDFLLFCTQTPDYPLPTTACLMQERLQLRRSIGALDFNLGCSGFVYGLALADGLIRTGSAGRILLITAETYTKFIHPEDRSLRTIFGDGASATLVEAADRPTLLGFRYGTDGTGADTLLMTRGGARAPEQAHKPRHRQRWDSDLYMDGPALITFTVDAVPQLIGEVLESAGWGRAEINYYLMHQATYKMMTYLYERLKVDHQRMPVVLEDCGNTVSSTIPIVIDRLRGDGRLQPGVRSLLIAFGVGWSWAGCAWEETWRT